MTMLPCARRVVVAVALLPILVTAAPSAAKASDRCSAPTRALQQRLTQLGYPTGGIDGCPGAATRAGVIAFQRAQGLAGDGIAGPATRTALAKPRALRPLSPAAGRRIEVDLKRQLLLRVERGRVAAAYAISSGATRYRTPSGAFRVFRKETRSWSVPYRVWLPWASYFSGGVAVHAGDVKPYPASHGCVRVPGALAKEIYAFMGMGTRVLVL